MAGSGGFSGDFSKLENLPDTLQTKSTVKTLIGDFEKDLGSWSLTGGGSTRTSSQSFKGSFSIGLSDSDTSFESTASLTKDLSSFNTLVGYYKFVTGNDPLQLKVQIDNEQKFIDSFNQLSTSSQFFRFEVDISNVSGSVKIEIIETGSEFNLSTDGVFVDNIFLLDGSPQNQINKVSSEAGN